MRMIQVSTDVFQAIWAARKPGEETEDEILRRTLAVNATPVRRASLSEKVGFRDKLSGVEFPDGFTIFRRYLGKDYSAVAHGGEWRLEGTSLRAPSLNQLSALVGPKQENAWENWKYHDPSGEVRKISALRDPAKVHARTRRI